MSKKIIHFISAVSNLIYRNPDAAGDISCVMIDGISYYPRSQPEIETSCCDNMSLYVAPHNRIKCSNCGKLRY